MGKVLIVSGLLAVVAVAVLVVIVGRVRAAGRRRALAAADRNRVVLERWFDLRPTDAERQLALNFLDEAFALGRIDQEDHARRVETVLKAETNRDAQSALNDLRPPDPP
ncbi:DUF1707 domain-containing protein [Streptosporangium sp. NPDC050855]|uniref:DUF1707 domain-containing protein n=1 Tax=Streptosporangium sp. NPDC050855 TaxID=3366194 RepID=UPI00378EB197